MDIPLQFCWTRFGTEAAQSIEQILVRKEEERHANNGIFLWGIGNAVGPSILELVRRASVPEVIFSPIKSAPRAEDVSPQAVVAWTAGNTLRGETWKLPEAALVTSRFDPAKPRRSHYALVCYSEQRLCMAPTDRKIAVESLRNLLTGRKVGASQVTAIVERNADAMENSFHYAVSMQAYLVHPFFVRLTEPVVVPHDFAGSTKDLDWPRAVEQLWSNKTPSGLQLAFES